MRVESDFKLMKPSTDITANATAFAPEGQAKLSWLAGMKLEANDPAMLRVYGPRYWHQLSGVPAISLPERCTAVTLSFENAFGGSYQDQGQLLGSAYNPVGCGLRAAACKNKDNRVHQVERHIGLDLLVGKNSKKVFTKGINCAMQAMGGQADQSADLAAYILSQHIA